MGSVHMGTNEPMEYQGIDVHLCAKGESGRGLLLLHGWKCSAAMMGGIQDALSPRMRTVAVDFPGHGDGGKAEPPKCVWGIPDYAALALEIIRRYDLAPCDIIAHSFGCRVALYLAATEPEAVGRLILTGAAGIPNRPTAASQKRGREYHALKSCVRVLGSLPGLRDKASAWQEALIQKYGSADYKALSPHMREVFKQVISFDITPYLEKVQAPTILFWGTKDTETPLWMGREMEKRIPDAALITEEGATHFAYLERQAVFTRIAEEFLLKGRNE